jgi:hypothetical protein
MQAIDFSRFDASDLIPSEVITEHKELSMPLHRINVTRIPSSDHAFASAFSSSDEGQSPAVGANHKMLVGNEPDSWFINPQFRKSNFQQKE